MENLKKELIRNIRNFSFLLGKLILFHGCKVYLNESVSLQHAVGSGKRTKIETNYNQKLRYYKIVYEDGRYY